MDATQQIEDSYSEEEDEIEEKQEGPEKDQVAKLKVFKNDHIPETEFPLYVGENILGRDPAVCSVPLPARSVSSRHAVISISVFRSSNTRSNEIEAIEALLWDMGSLNGTRKGRLKLTPQVRYALAEGDSVVLADVPCQYISLHVPNKHTNVGPKDKVASKHKKQRSPSLSSSDSEPTVRKGVVYEKKRGTLPPVPLWSDEDEEPKNATNLCSTQPANKQPEITLVPDSDSDGESAIDERRDLVSDSASSSNLVSPSDSTCLTPARQIIPESEDESSITPSSAAMDRFKLKDSFSVDCSDSSKTGPLALNLDSDTDIEEEETERSRTGAEAQIEVASKVQPVSSADLHMDSDTDVEEEEMEKSKTHPEAVTEEVSKVESVTSADLHMDSDTDVDEEDTEKSKTEPEAQTKETQNLKSVTSADLHMDSDTDVEEEETEKSKIEPEPPTKGAPKVDSVTSPDLNMDSDTDVEESDASNELPKVLAVPESPPSAPPNANIQLDSDTDVEDDNPMDVPMAAEVSHPVVRDADIRPNPNLGTEFCMDSDTDVDEEDKDKKIRDPLSNSETDDEDPFKSLPGKTVNVAANQKTTSNSEGSTVEQSDKGTLKQINPIQTRTNYEEPTQAFDSPEDWDLQATQAYGVTGAIAGLRPKQLDLEATQAYGSEIDREEEEKEPLSHNEMYSNLSTAETQLILSSKSNDEDDNDDEEMHDHSHLSTADTVIIASTPRREEQTQNFALFSAPTQLMWEGEEKEVDQSDTTDETQNVEEDEENIKWGRRKTHVGRKMPKHKNISSSHIFIAETQPMCEDEEASDEGLNSAVSSKDTDHERKHLKGEPSSSNIAIEETQPMCEDEDASDEGLSSAVSSSDTDHEHKHLRGEPSCSNVAIAETQPLSEEEQTLNEDFKSRVNSARPNLRQQAEEQKSNQLASKSSISHITIAETQPMCEDENEPDEGLSNAVSSVLTGQDKAMHLTEEPLASHVTIAETQPMSGEEQTLNEDLKSAVNSATLDTNHESTQLADNILGTKKQESLITETQPICEEEEPPKQLKKTQLVDEDDEGQDKDLKSKMPSRRSRRGRPKKEEVAQDAEAVVHHTIPTTEGICEEDEEQNIELKSRRSCRGRPKKEEVAPAAEAVVFHTIPTTEPICEEDEKDEEQNIELKSRRTRRGRPIKKNEIPQPAVSLVTETQPVPEEKNEGEDLNSGIRSKGSRRGKQRDDPEPKSDLNIVETQPVTEGNVQEEPANAGSSSQRRQPRGRRQMKEKTDQENEAGASSKGPGRARKGQEGKRKRGKVLSEDEEESEEEKTRRGTRRTGLKQKCNEKEGEEELEENIERIAQEEKEKIEKELQEQEERERLEREENERLECERKEREEREAKERVEREQKELEEKERLEREEEERIRKEKEEHEAMERLKREAEEKDRLERELKNKLERQQLEKEEEEIIQRVKEQKDKMEKESLQRLEAEREQLEKERQENERLEMTAKAQLNKEQKKKEEMNQHEKQKNETLKEKNAEMNASPVSPNDDAPVRRSRRHSNSSVNSEQSVASQQEQPSQRGKGRGRGRGRGRPTANKQPISGRQTGRRKTFPGHADGVEDTEPDSTPRSRSRSNSRSSERSSNSSRTPDQSARGRDRKSVKVPQPEEEVSQAKTPGKGRGKGVRGTNVDNINVESSKHEQDAEVVEEAVKPQTNSRGRKRAATASTSSVEEAVKPQTNSRGRKRAATASTSSVETPPPTPKTPRRSVASQMPKVLFTGLTDEDAERVVARLGGSLAKGVNDMTHLVTDKARRTVKFLCAVARGVPIVTPDWLQKCGKAGSFISADDHLLKDVEQEKKFSFSLQASLQTALHQPLLNGYEIHVTKSVIPEPSQMKEIIACCGARFLPKMPSAHKEHTVVVSCEQDRALCAKALSMSLPVVSTEFLLTGILQQKVDLQAYALTFTPNTTNQPTTPKTPSRGRRK
nr:mediator of DNA damage checkpoint protein 1 [Misgurnus anguillicaudatus]